VAAINHRALNHLLSDEMVESIRQHCARNSAIMQKLAESISTLKEGAQYFQRPCIAHDSDGLLR
jgi:hypothetical protein